MFRPFSLAIFRLINEKLSKQHCNRTHENMTIHEARCNWQVFYYTQYYVEFEISYFVKDVRSSTTTFRSKCLTWQLTTTLT